MTGVRHRPDMIAERFDALPRVVIAPTAIFRLLPSATSRNKEDLVRSSWEFLRQDIALKLIVMFIHTVIFIQ